MRVLIADDHPLFRAAVGQALKELLGDDRPLEASSFRTLEDTLMQNADVELVLLDLHMPGARGFSSLVSLRGEWSDIPVIIISSNDHPRTIRRAQQFGASGFIPKAAPVQHMMDAIRAVMAGGTWFPPLTADKSADDARLATRLAQLTPQQVRVLMCLADGLLNKQIAAELGLAENTVKVHVTAILRKLECDSRTQAALIVKSLQPDAPVEPEGMEDLPE